MWDGCVQPKQSKQEDNMKLQHYITDAISLLGIFAIAIAMLAL
jgi:hypothetical protein